MDLVQTVRKEGSRGGAGDFKWSDVQASSHREHYLGHSIMAPTGRWAKGKDLTWYAKGDRDNAEGEAAMSEADARKEEIRRIKEAEQDAMAKALGLPVPDRSNPNTQELGKRKEVEQALKSTSTEDQTESKGIGYAQESGVSTRRIDDGENVERIEGNAEQQDKELQYALKEYRRRLKDDRRGERSRSRSRSRSPHRHRDRKHRKRRSRDREHRRRSRSRDRDYRRRTDSELGDRERHHRRRGHRTRSPHRDDQYESRDRHSSRRDR